MRFTIEKNRLADVIGIVSKGMSSRSTLPIFGGIYIEATQDGVIFQTTDLEISIKHIAEALIEGQGAAVVPGKLFGEIIKSMPEAAITLDAGADEMRISSIDTTFTVKTMNPVDFPTFPQIIPTKSLTLPSAVLAQAVKKVAKAVSKDESRAVLTGIFFKAEGDSLQLVATDSYRLAISKTKLSAVLEDGLEVIVPGSVLEEVSRLAGKEDVTLGESENQIVFAFGTTTFISRKIEGNYPNYEQIIPVNKEITATIDSATLLSAMKRASILAQSHTPIKVKLDPVSQTVTVAAATTDVGAAEEKLVAQIDGEPLEIGFNHQYIIDGMSAVDTEEVLFEAQTALKPGIIKAVGDDFFFYLTMPVRLER